MSVGKFMFICFTGLLLNLLGSAVAEIFNLPIFLDTSGTIFIAALGSYMPGIAVGFLTNLLKSLFDSHQMYYASFSIIIAIFTTVMARRGFFLSLGKVIVLIPLIAIFMACCSVNIENFLRSANLLQTVSEFNTSFVKNFSFEFIDKTISVLLAFFLIKKTPNDIKKSFRTLGQRQAPLSEEMKRAVDNEDYLSSSLRTKLLLILMLSSFFVSFSIAFISYQIFKDAALGERIKSVSGITTVILSELNPAQIDNFVNHGRNDKNYKAVESKLYTLKNTNPEIRYIYVYRFSEAGCQVVFDISTADFTGDNAGEIIEFDPAAFPYKDDLIAGRPVPPIISNDEYGRLLTIYKPLYDDKGKCQCYAAVDLSLDSLTEETGDFVIRLLTLFVGCFIFIFVLGLWFIENNIILPLNTMAYCARSFSYDNAAERQQNMEMIKGLKITTGDEIENLYSALIRSAENVAEYLEHLKLAKVEVANMKVKVLAMDELANTDSLTGIKNKTAYATRIYKLDERIEAGNANFCIVMVDVNFLKKVNDNYGHERGNEYLVNACRLVCSVFGEEHVYRIGGDEFVVIVEGEKVSLCKYFVNQFKAEMNRKAKNPLLEPWEKISAAVGVAFYEAGVDQSADEVFKRADKLMYENKLAMKAQRTD